MKKTVFVMAALMLAMVFGGCKKPAENDEIMVGYAVMRMVDEYWGNQIKGMQSANAAGGNTFKLEIADSNNDGQVCLENALSLLSRGARVLMVSPPDPKIGAAIMEKANSLNVPVISSDVYIDGTYFLTHDEVKAGEIVGEFAARYYLDTLSSEKAKVAILTHAAVASQVDQRIQGFKTGFSRLVPDAVYLPEQDAEGLREKGANLTADIITANPDVNIIFGINDDIALGAASSVQARGLTGKIACFGQGGIGEATFQALLEPDNPFKGTAAFMPFGHGEAAVNELILPLLQGKMPPQSVHSPLEIASASNARRFLDEMAAIK
ncbi:MAG: sugar ABC transporter substrate-binding protein [Treponema sp.]|nr:sugar ABC transporter substrate-binding protein [Treponema sp.]